MALTDRAKNAILAMVEPAQYTRAAREPAQTLIREVQATFERFGMTAAVVGDTYYILNTHERAALLTYNGGRILVAKQPKLDLAKPEYKPSSVRFDPITNRWVGPLDHDGALEDALSTLVIAVAELF